MHILFDEYYQGYEGIIMPMHRADKTLDIQGLAGTRPAMVTRDTLQKMGLGQTLMVIANDKRTRQIVHPTNCDRGFDQTRETDAILLITFLLLIGFPLLYLFRHLDDNALTSWQWVFSSPVSMLKIFLLLLTGVLLSIALSGLPMNNTRAHLLLFPATFIAVLPLWSEPESILDASRYFLQAKHLGQYGVAYFLSEWGRAISAWTDLPAVPLMYGLIFKYMGEARVCIQIFNTILFSLTVVLTYSIGRRLWNGSIGAYASLMLIGIPYLLIQVPLMLVDVPVMFLLTLSIFTYLDALERGGMLRMSMSACVIVLTVFSKYSAWPMLIVLVTATIVSIKMGSRSAIARSIVILTSAGAVSFVIILSRYELFTEQIRLLRDYQWPGLKRWKEGLVSTFLFQIHPFISLLAALGVIAALRRRDFRFLIPGWFVVFVSGLGVERARYILPLFPLLALMAAYGLRELLDSPRVRRFVVSLIAISSLTLAIGAYLPFLKAGSMSNLEDAGRYIDTLPGDEIEVRILPQRRSSGNTEAAIPILDLYTRKRILYRKQQTEYDRPAAQKSSLRFTWEMGFLRPYAYETEDRSIPLVVIADEIGAVYSHPGIREGHDTATLKTFYRDTGAFRYKTAVVILSRESSVQKSTASAARCPVRASQMNRNN